MLFFCVVVFMLFCVVLCPVVFTASGIVVGLVKICRTTESANKTEQSNLLHRSMAIQMSFVPLKTIELYSFTKDIMLITFACTF